MQDERPDQAFDVTSADRGEAITVGGMRRGKRGWIVLDGSSSEELPSARRIEHVHLVSCTGKCAYLAGAPEAPERCEGGRFPAGGPLDRFGIYEIHGNGLDAKFLDIRKAGDRASGVTVIHGAGVAQVCSVDVLLKSCEDLDGMRARHVEKATPDLGRWEAECSEARDTAKIVSYTFQRPPKVSVD